MSASDVEESGSARAVWEYLASVPRPEWRAIRRLVAFLAERGRGVLEVTAADLEAFRAAGLNDLAHSQRVRHVRRVRAFYLEQFRAGRVTLEIATAVGADPLEISPDAAAIRAYLGENRGTNERVALGLLAAFCLRSGKGPLAVTPEELEAFIVKPLGRLAPGTQHSYLVVVRRFYRSAFAAGDVSLAVVMVVARPRDARELSPDAEAIGAFLNQHGGREASAALGLLASFFGRLGKGPLAATPEELEAFVAERLGGYTSSTRSAYLGSVRGL
jgi:hypothetical protein